VIRRVTVETGNDQHPTPKARTATNQSQLRAVTVSCSCRGEIVAPAFRPSTSRSVHYATRLEVALYISLGLMLGWVLQAMNVHAGLLRLAGDTGESKKKEPAKGIFSPPGTFEGGTVVPAPNPPPFNGKVGQTIGESTPDWPPLARAPKGAPNVMYIVLDDVGYAALGCYGSPICETPHMDKLAANGVRL